MHITLKQFLNISVSFFCFSLLTYGQAFADSCPQATSLQFIHLENVNTGYWYGVTQMGTQLQSGKMIIAETFYHDGYTLHSEKDNKDLSSKDSLNCVYYLQDNKTGQQSPTFIVTQKNIDNRSTL